MFHGGLGYKRGSDITECDIVEVRVYDKNGLQVPSLCFNNDYAPLFVL